jgi:DNA modification methylase
MEDCQIFQKDCVEMMKEMEEGTIDLTVTSPPYDQMRSYNDSSAWSQQHWERIIKLLYDVTKKGGVVVWVVGDQHTGKGESGSSFRQALYFQETGFFIHDTMIYQKPGFSDAGSLSVRYGQVFEYMFIFSKGKIQTFNPLIDRKNKSFGRSNHGTIRNRDGSLVSQRTIGKPHREYGQRFNVWKMKPQPCNFGHPAPFPFELARDHILSWSNKNDLVFDPFLGSGTTAKAAIETGRRFVGCEIDKSYFEIAQKKVSSAQLPLF